MPERFYLVEHLSLRSCFLNVLPYLLKARSNKCLSKTLYYIDATALGLFLSQLCLKLLGLPVQQLNFELPEVRDSDGNSLRLRIAYFDLFKIQEAIVRNPIFQNFLKNIQSGNRFPLFLVKQIALIDTVTNLVIWRALFIVQVAKFKAEQLLGKNAQITIFMTQRVWFKEIVEYGFSQGVEVVPAVNIRVVLKSLLQNLFAASFKVLRNAYVHIKKFGVKSTWREFWRYKQVLNGQVKSLPKLAVEYYGHLNLDQPQLYSDLFFWQQSELAAEDLLVTFHLPRDPLDQKKLAQLAKHNINAIAIDPLAALGDVPRFTYWAKSSMNKLVTKYFLKNEKTWLWRHKNNYYNEYDYWYSLFSRQNIKLYLTWFKYNALHCVMADSLNACGGVMAIYQRAMEELPTPETAISTDIVFGFSSANALVEQQSNSTIPYHITVGYPGDHRFKLLKQHAEPVRANLQKHGAEKIIAFFDENSSADARWHSGHEMMRSNYEFLLEKMLDNPWLGLVFKPKVSATLRARLGPVAQLLKQAEATGRCFVFEAGVLHSSYPPAIAALVSDVTIHGHLCAATAGLEAALTGVPTLLLDREGWRFSPLYKLGVGKVVFSDWFSLWMACLAYLKNKTTVFGFGSWQPFIKEIDPFCDGRAAERIGTYLNWLMQGFKANLTKEKILADCAQRYADLWGKDKVNEVKPQKGFIVD